MGRPKAESCQQQQFARDCELVAEPASGPSGKRLGWPKAADCVPAELAVAAMSRRTRCVTR